MKSSGIKARMLFVALVPLVILSLLLTGHHIRSRFRDLDKSLVERGAALVRQLAPASEYGVFAGNEAFLLSLVNTIIEERDVRAVEIVDSDGRILARNGPSFRAHDVPSPLPGTAINVHIDRPGVSSDAPASLSYAASQDGLSMMFQAPVLQNQYIVDEFGDFNKAEQFPDSEINPSTVELGRVRVELSRTSTLLQKDRLLRSSLFVTLSLLAVTIVALSWQVGRVTKPVRRLSAAARQLEEGELKGRLAETSGGELGILEKSLNAIAARQQQEQENVRQQVDRATLSMRETLETLEIQNAQLALAKKEALVASDVKSEFLASMSHEIRTPLNGILGYTELLLKAPLDEEQQSHAQTIKRSGESLLRIVNDILDFSKIESGNLELENVDILLRDCVEDVLELMAPNAHEKGLELVYVMYSDVPSVVRGDPVRLRQVLVNLVSNAVKFTDSGSVVVRIMREDETRSHMVVRFSVSDTGVGLSDEDRRRLFRAFSQAERNPAGKIGGTGLGLVICKKLVERMHGQIALESAQGKGTTVSFTVRCEKSRGAMQTPAPSLRGRRALLFEAHPITRLSLLEDLTAWGLKVLDTGDARRLREAVKTKTGYHIAVLGLPAEEDNPAAARELVELVVQGCGCPVLALANTTEQSRLSALTRMGVSSALSKPVRIARLKGQVEYLLTGQPAATFAEDGSRPNAKPSSDLVGIRVLVAEDNEVSRRLAAYLLESRGADVTVAVDGREALERLVDHSFDIVLMDVHMPEMDGATVTSMVRSAEQGGRHTPVIALTADALEGNRERFLAAGMDDYLSKPIDEGSLFAMVKKWVGVGRASASGHREDTEAAATSRDDRRPQVLDWEQTLRATAGNEQLASELLGMLLQETRVYPEKLQNALDDEQLAVIVELAHKLAGGAAHCAAQAVRASARLLEQAARKGDTALVSHRIAELDGELQRLRQAVSERESAA